MSTRGWIMKNPTRIYTLLKPLTKQQILKFSNITCEHGHPLVCHTTCLEKEIKWHERIGFLDIETSGLNANYGLVLTYCILSNDSGKILEGWLTEKDFQRKDLNYDKRIIAKCIKDMSQFDRLIVYWGKDRRHDIPFLRTRALTMNLDFPIYHEQIVNDLYDIVKNKLRLGRNSLQAACIAMGIESKTHPISPKVWLSATMGRSKTAMRYILEHNREDVQSTQTLWRKLNRFSSNPKTSV